MTLDTLITKLEEMRERHGNLPVYIGFKDSEYGDEILQPARSVELDNEPRTFKPIVSIAEWR